MQKNTAMNIANPTTPLKVRDQSIVMGTTVVAFFTSSLI